MKYLLSTLFLAFCLQINAQQINEEIFAKTIDILYASAKGHFKDIKTESMGETTSGEAKFGASRKLSGSSDVYIKVDGENSQTYVALFEFEDAESANSTLERMLDITLANVPEEGFTRKKGTDISYEGYRKHTIEFDTDNIDLMGRYPSFSFGIVKGVEPITVEMQLNEPLWK